MASQVKRVLIVDDEAQITSMLRSFFQGDKYVVETASNGADALRLLQKNRPDLVLLDITMPEMDGIETLRQIRALDRKIPVIMVTGTSDVSAAGKALAQGALAYIPKPFDFTYLDHLTAVAFSR